MQTSNVDPSLRTEPTLETLDDGFSPPAPAQAQQEAPAPQAQPASPNLGAKSPF